MPFRADYFEQCPNSLDEDGVGLVHYVALLSREGAEIDGSPAENHTRWMVPTKKRCRLYDDNDLYNDPDEESSSDSQKLDSADFEGLMSRDEDIEGWNSEEVNGEGDDMAVEEPIPAEDLSLDPPAKLMPKTYLEKDPLHQGVPVNNLANLIQEEEARPEYKNPFAYNSGAKVLKDFKEALDLLRGDINLTSAEGESAVLLLCKSSIPTERAVGRLKALLAKQANIRIPVRTFVV